MTRTSLDEVLRAAGRAGPGSTVEVVERAGRTTIYEIVDRQPNSERRVWVIDVTSQPSGAEADPPPT